MALALALVLALVLGSEPNVQVLQEEVTCRIEVVLGSSLAVLSPAAWRPQQVPSVFHNRLHHQCLVAVRVSTQAGVGEIYDALIWHILGVGVGEWKVADPSV